MTRRALAKAYVGLMGKYSAKDLSAAVAELAKGSKLDVDLLAKDISAEILYKKQVLTGTLSVAHELPAAQLDLVKQALVKVLGENDIQMDIIVDERLIGGFVAETPAGTVDSSVITMLERMEVA